MDCSDRDMKGVLPGLSWYGAIRHQIRGESQSRGRQFQLRDLTEHGQASRGGAHVSGGGLVHNELRHTKVEGRAATRPPVRRDLLMRRNPHVAGGPRNKVADDGRLNVSPELLAHVSTILSPRPPLGGWATHPRLDRCPDGQRLARRRRPSALDPHPHGAGWGGSSQAGTGARQGLFRGDGGRGSRIELRAAQYSFIRPQLPHFAVRQRFEADEQSVRHAGASRRVAPETFRHELFDRQDVRLTDGIDTDTIVPSSRVDEAGRRWSQQGSCRLCWTPDTDARLCVRPYHRDWTGETGGLREPAQRPALGPRTPWPPRSSTCVESTIVRTALRASSSWTTRTP